MAFNRELLDPSAFHYGKDGATIDLGAGDFIVPNNCKGVVVVAAGNVVCRPQRATADITITAAPVGYVLPWHCIKIESVGTTATLATILD